MSDKDPFMDDMQQIASFADGELTGEQNLRMLEQVQADPALADRIRHQQQLRQACQRAMSEPAHAPDTLKTQIAAMAQQASPEATPASPTVLARIGRWVPAAVAAVLMIGAITLYNASIQPKPPESIDSAMTQSVVDRFDKRHITCAESIKALDSDPSLPNNLVALPSKLQERFHQPVPGLDLTALGYRFEGVGECTLPGKNAVHLVYRADTSTGRHDAVSLWMRPDDGKLAIEPGRIYARNGTDPSRRILVWKQGNMVYYLLGDETQRMDDVADALRQIS